MKSLRTAGRADATDEAAALSDEEGLRSKRELDPLPSLLPPEGVVVNRMADVVSRARQSRRTDVAGVRGSAGALLAARLARDESVVAVAPDADSARALARDLEFFLGSREGVLLVTASDHSPWAAVHSDRPGALTTMATLGHLATGRPFRAVVASASAVMRKFIPPEVVATHTLRLVAEGEVDRDELVQKLSETGYLRVPLVEDPGTFAVRGALVDVWPPGIAHPHRVELYGDLVLSIRPFDPQTQTTSSANAAPAPPKGELWLPPARDVILAAEYVERAKSRVTQLAEAMDWPTKKTRALTDDVATGRAFFGSDAYMPAYYADLAPLSHYVPENAPWILLDPTATTRAIRDEWVRAERDAAAKANEPHFLTSTFYRSEEEIAAEWEARRTVVLHATEIGGSGTGLDGFETSTGALSLAASDNEDLTRAVKAARGAKANRGSLAPLGQRIRHFRDHGFRVFLTARAETQAERLTTLLAHQGVTCTMHARDANASWLGTGHPGASSRGDAEIVVGPLGHGLVLPGEGLAFVTEEEIFRGRTHRPRTRRARDAARPFLEDLQALAVGDFVVHAEHGIGRYEGLIHRDVGGLTVDLLVVQYAGGDKLYLPVYRLNQIQKFSGSEGGEPKIDRLGGATFAKTKARVAKAVRQMADDLLRLYAERQAQSGYALAAPDDDYRAFEATFAFDETEDQGRAIEDVNRDLETPRAMDRLVCGDVGFGKTEVAMRAAFRVAMSGRQVAILCPTTVLAQQHFRTFEARMADYPIALRVFSRFQSKRESDAILAQLKEGKVDIVVGTHRLLSKDVHFKELGLLVVDEEQRFGVTHKERIKSLRAQVDVLTLSATPIPRTLQMAVSGIRDLSLITTPPVDRRAVRTLVSAMDDQILTEAIGRELSRGGQVFYVYNRIEGIYERAERVRRLFPEARIAVAHGQMAMKAKEGESALEQTMLDFVEGRYDILVATAIVESGLDIPRANTIVIDRADLFGLAQLYQLRGRVGRSKERAYCYLIVPPPNTMTDDARARIEALERHTELGSGFKIASLDLELRGAGDLLGAEQSGNVASVGLDMFCQMLDEAVHELRGEPVIHDVDPELSFDVTALLPDDYIADVGVRLSLYKRLASAIDEGEVGALAIEMEDRFGPPPGEAKCLVRLMTLKCELRRIRVLGCEATARSVTLHLREDTPLDPAKISELVRSKGSLYKLTPDMRLTRRADPREALIDGLVACEAMVQELASSYRG